jgi:biotin synthase
MSSTVQQIRDAIFAGGRIDKPATLRLLASDPEDLWRAADGIRRHFCGARFDLCSIINAKSGNCTENCRFCAQSARHRTGIESYETVAEDEALIQTRDNDDHGVHRISLVASGRSLSPDTLAELTRLLGKMTAASSMRLCASAGFLTEEIAADLYAAGVRRYHCNLEASQRFFPQVCTTHTWAEKVETLRLARTMGMSLCSGGIIGMGESMEDRIDMAFALRELEVKSIPVNLLTPIAGTPLAELTPLSVDEVLSTVALFRCINPDAVIRMAGGRQQLGAEQYRCFTAGANGAIVGNYLTTTGSSVADDLARLSALGFTFERPAS